MRPNPYFVNIENYDPPVVTIINERTSRARHARSCTICGQTIHLGERYTRIVYRDDDALDQPCRVISYHICCPEEPVP